MDQVSKLAFSKEQGSALVVALIVLLLMTLVGVSSMKNSISDISISKSFSSYDYAFQAAEKALRVTEKKIIDASSEEDLETALGAFNVHIATTDTDATDYENRLFWNNINFFSNEQNVKIVVELDQIINGSEDLSNPGVATFYYKIIALGIDGVYAVGNAFDYADTVAVLVTIFAKRYNGA